MYFRSEPRRIKQLLHPERKEHPTRASHPGIPPRHPARASHLGIPPGLPSVSPPLVCSSMSDKWGLPCRLEASFLSLSYLSRSCLATTFAWAAGDYLPVGVCVLQWLVAKPLCVSGPNRAFLPPMGQWAQNVLTKAQNPGSLGSSWLPDSDSFKQTKTPSVSARRAAACASRPFPPKFGSRGKYVVCPSLEWSPLKALVNLKATVVSAARDKSLFILCL